MLHAIDAWERTERVYVFFKSASQPVGGACEDLLQSRSVFATEKNVKTRSSLILKNNTKYITSLNRFLNLLFFDSYANMHVIL